MSKFSFKFNLHQDCIRTSGKKPPSGCKTNKTSTICELKVT